MPKPPTVFDQIIADRRGPAQPQRPFPLVPPDLLAALLELFPDQAPAPGQTHAECMASAGWAQVTRLLRRKLAEQQDNILSRPVKG